MVQDIGQGHSSQKGTHFVSVQFCLVDDMNKKIVRKYYTTDAAMSFFKDLYDAAFPNPNEWDFPDNPRDPGEHESRLRGKIVWIHVEEKDDYPDPEVTACRADSDVMPTFKPRKRKPGAMTRESAQDARTRMLTQEDVDPDPTNNAGVADDDIPF
jgi:hypothetical protein